jgi:hypothetical protein
VGIGGRRYADRLDLTERVALNKAKFVFLTALLPALTALSACGGVRLQTADEFSASVYSSEQSRARSACLSRNSSSSDLSDCLRRANMSFEDYKKEREKAKTAKPADQYPK